MMLPNGANLGDLGVLDGCHYRVTKPLPAYWLRFPWGEVACVRLTAQQMIEMCTEDLVLLPVLHFGKDEDGGSVCHTHPIAIEMVDEESVTSN